MRPHSPHLRKSDCLSHAFLRVGPLRFQFAPNFIIDINIIKLMTDSRIDCSVDVGMNLVGFRNHLKGTVNSFCNLQKIKVYLSLSFQFFFISILFISPLPWWASWQDPPSRCCPAPQPPIITQQIIQSHVILEQYYSTYSLAICRCI